MIATLTSKGQLTIPKAVREKLSLHTGTHVSFVVIDGRAELTPISTPLRTLKTILPKTEKKLTLEEIERAIARGASQ